MAILETMVKGDCIASNRAKTVLLLLVFCACITGCQDYVTYRNADGSDSGTHFDEDSLCKNLDWIDLHTKVMMDELGIIPDCAQVQHPMVMVVVRDEDCWESWSLNGLSDEIDFNTQELVALCDIYWGCGWDLQVSSVRDCVNNIEIDYNVIRPCETCHDFIPMCIFILISGNTKPIEAIPDLVEEDCT